MFKITIPNAIQLQASAVAKKRCRRFWAHLVPDLRCSSLAWVSGLLALLVVAVSPVSAQSYLDIYFVVDGVEVESGGVLMMEEGTEKSYSVRLRLSEAPDSTVELVARLTSVAQLTIIDDSGTPLGPGGSSQDLAIDSTNYEVGVTVTVKAKNNNVLGDNNPEIILHQISGGDRAVTLSVMITDDNEDTPTIKLMLDQDFVTEGYRGGYRGTLTVTAKDVMPKRLQADTNLTLILPDTDRFTVVEESSAVQPIMKGGSISWVVFADLTANDTLGDIETVIFDVMADPGVEIVSIPAKLKIGNINPAVLVVQNSLEVEENLNVLNYSYPVRLISRPTDTVMVTVEIEGYYSHSPTNSQIHLLDGGQKIGNLTLLFDPESWDRDSGKEVYIEVDDNMYSGENRIATIIHMASNGGYDGVQPKDLSVIIDDNEDTPTISLSLPGTLNNSVNEGFQGNLLVRAMLDGPARLTETVLTLVLPGDDDRFTFTFVDPSQETQTIPAKTPNGFIVWDVELGGGSANKVLGDAETVTFTLMTASGLAVSPAKLKIVDASEAEIVVMSSRTVREKIFNPTYQYKVRLTSQPTDAVHVTVSIEDYALSQMYLLDQGAQVGALTLEFDSGNWDSGEDVRFIAMDNSYSGENREETIIHSAAGGGYDGAQTKRLRVVVADNEDMPTILLSLPENTNNSVNEEFEGNLLIRAMLDGPARQTDTVLILVLPDERFTLVAGGEETQTIPARTADVIEWILALKLSANNILGDTRTVTFTVMTSSGLAVVPAKLKIVDVSEAKIVVSTSSLTVSEDSGNSSYTVSLSSRPSDTVHVTVSLEDFVADNSQIYLLNNGGQVGALTLEFHSGNWESGREVQFVVTGNIYSGKNREEIITHSAAGGAYDGARMKRLQVVVTDDELTPTITLGLTRNNVKLDSVEEGFQEQFLVTAMLDGPARQTGTDMTLMLPDSFTFVGGSSEAGTILAGDASISWNVQAGVGINDILGDTETVTFTLMTASGLAVSPATLKIVDASEAEIVVMSSRTVREKIFNPTYQYKVRLTSQPTDAVHVTVSIEDYALSQMYLLDQGAQVGALTLEFDSGNWDSGEDVRFIAMDNSYSGENREETIIHSAEGGGYDGAQTKRLRVVVADNEDMPTIRLSLPENTNNSVNEEFEGNLLIRAMLDGPARQTDTVLILVLPDERFTLVAGSEETQTIPARTADVIEWILALKLSANNILGDTRTVTFSVMTLSGLAVGPAKLKIVDVSEAKIVVSTSSMTVSEDSGNSSYTVSLSSRPSDTVHVTVSLEDFVADNSQIYLLNNGGQVGALMLEFHSGNWESGREVQFVVTGNIYSGKNREEIITHGASGGGYDGARMKRLQVVVTDDELTPTITLGLTRNNVKLDSVEEGFQEQFLVTAMLDGPARQTGTDMTLMLPDSFAFVGGSSEAGTILAGDASISWNVQAGVGINDILGDAETVTFTLMTASGLAVSPATLKIVDASEAEIVVVSSVAVDEDVMNSSYRVSLTSRPTDTVVVTVSIEDFDNSEISLLDGDGQDVGMLLTLEFDSGNWDSGKDVQFAVTDNIYWGKNREEVITHSASGGGYDGAQLKILRVVVTDNEDTPTILLSLNTEKLSEGHKEQLVVTARLEGISQMDTDLTLVLPGEEFTVNEAFRARTILARATTDVSWFVDADVGTNTILGDTRSVTFSVTTASGLAVVPAKLKIVDASPAEIVVSSSLTVSEEAGNSSYRVSLSSRPTDTVVVTVRIDDVANSPIRLIGGGGADGTLTLVFHSGNWESGGEVQFVVTGNIYSGKNREEIITHGAVGGGYDGAGEKRLQVVVTDDELTPTITLGLTRNNVKLDSVEEGFQEQFLVTAMLDGPARQTGTDMTLMLPDSFAFVGGSSEAGTILAGDASISWNVQAGVGINDILGDAEIVTFTLMTASGLAVVPATLKIVDASPAAIVVTSSVAVDEDVMNSSYRVSLTSQPTDTVVVTVRIEDFDNSEISLLDGDGQDVGMLLTLEFDAGNWDSGKDVQFAVTDNIYWGKNREEVITHSASDGGYDGAQLKILRVVVTDNEDTPTILLSLNTEKLSEGHKEQLVVTASLEGISQMDTDLTLVLPGEEFTVNEAFRARTILAGATTAVSWFVDADVGTNTILGDTRSVTFSVTTASGLAVVPAKLKIVDASPAEIVVSSSLTVSEEAGNSSYRVSLSSRPTDTVVVTVRIEGYDSENSQIHLDDGGADGTLTLVFNSGNWEGGQDVDFVVTGNDYSGENREETIIHGAAGGAYDGAGEKRLQVVVTDDEEAAVRVSMTMSVLSATEAEVLVVELLVRLVDSNDEVVMLPEGGETPVTFEVSPGEAAEDYTVVFSGPTTVQIPSTGVRSVVYTLTLIRDFIDEEDETFTITAKVAGLSDGSATFTIIDHPGDVRGIEIGTIADLREGREGMYTVVLKSRPTDPVTVAFSTTSDEVALSPSLVFSTTDWETPQNIVVSAMENSISDGQRDLVITYVVSGGDYDAFPLTSTIVAILDDDAASTRVGLSLEPAGAREGDTTSTSVTVTVTAELDASPRSQVTTVQLSLLLNLDADADDVDLHFPNGDMIEILSGETTASIDVRLSLTDNDIFEEDESFSILGSVVDLVDGEAIFTIIDDDVRGISISQTTIEMTEGALAVYDLVLTSEPTAEVTVVLSFIEPEGVSFSINGVLLVAMRLFFTPENWDISKVILVTANDNDHIQQRTTTVTIEHLASGGGYADLQESVKVAVMDDEPERTTITLSLLDESLQNLENLEESGGSLTVYVAAEIGTRLYVDVPIALTYGGAAADSEDYTLTPVAPVDGTLLIPAGERRGTATFVLTLNDDRIDEDNETVEIVGTASGDVADFIASISPASFLIIDNDTRAVLVTPTPAVVTVPEGGGRRSYTLRLDSQPDGGDVVVKITAVSRASEDEGRGRTLSFFQGPAGNAAITSAPDGNFTPAGEGIVLTFTAANWFEEQAVYVELPSNDVVQDDSEATITHSVSGGDYDTVTVPPVVLKLREFGFFVSNPRPATVLEGGAAAYSIRLASQPGDTVIVKLMLPSNPGIGLSLATSEVLTFSTADWNEAQSVIVAYGDDDLSTGDQTLVITHSAESNDTNYDSEGASVAAVRLNFIDDEPLPKLRLLLSPNSAVEGSGGTDGSQRTQTIEVMATAEFEGPPRSEDTIISLSLARNNSAGPGDYSTTLTADAFLLIPQGATASTDGTQHSSFMLTLFQDHIDEGDEAFTLIAADSAAILAETSTVFTILDDDSAGIDVTPVGPRRLRKGQTSEYSVALTSEPTATVMVSVEAMAAGTSEVDPAVDVGIATAPLSFDAGNWFVPQRVTVTAVEPAGVDPRFGEVNIVFSVASDVASYDGTFEETRMLEIIDVDATLSRLQLMVGGEEIVLTNLADGSTGFMSDGREYSAAIPVAVDEVTITAAPSVTRTPVEAGEQNPGEVRIFGTNLPRDAGGMGAPGAELTVPVDLSGEDDFTFFVEVFVPVDDGADFVIGTTTLTLTRALPAAAEFLVFRADDAGRRNPLNDGGEDDTLIFGPEDEIMELVLVLTDGVDDYGIGELRLSASANPVSAPDGVITITLSDGREFQVTIAEEEEKTRTLETKVTLSRVDPRGEDLEFSLPFEAEPARPIAADAAADADAFTAEIDVFLEDNTPTNTEISVAYRGDSQGQAETLTLGEIRVSDNGTVTISLEVIYESGGMRSFEQGSFTFSAVSAPAADAGVPANDPIVTLEGGILKINSEGEELDLLITVSAAAHLDLVARGFSEDRPLDVGFTVKFVHPTANIQPVAQPVVEFDPVREFTDPLFVFVNELKELPLEVVLAEDIPLDGSGGVLRALTLTLTTDIPEALAATVSIRVGDAEAGSPGRILSFEVAAVQNNVLVDVAIDVDDQDPRVAVAPFRFKTHFLSLAHEDEIQFSEVGNRGGDFAPDFEVVTVSLAGEEPENERWSLSVANRDQLEGDGHYSVEEVILEIRITQVNQIVKKIVAGITTTYEIGTETLLDGVVSEPAVFVEVDTTTLSAAVSADVLARLSASPRSLEIETLGEEIARKDYRPLTEEEMGEERETRFLRITRLLPGAEDSRVVLRFDYYLTNDPAAELEGFFYRTVAIDTGLAAELRVAVTPDPVVVPKGGMGDAIHVFLVVSNLQLGEDPAGFITFRTDADLSIVPLGNGNLDPINRSFTQTLQVTVNKDADRPSYKVVVEVRLRGKVFATEFTVDVNDPPRYEGPRRLTVYESDTGDETEPRIMTFSLRIVDADGGRDLLEPTGLMLEVVGFETTLPLGDDSVYSDNPYFNLSTTAAIRDQGNEGESASGQLNSLAVMLTLVGKLAMPYGSVVELRLSGVDDGYGDGFGDIVGSLLVRVEDVAPVFELATTTVAVFLDEEARIPFADFSDGSTEGSGVPTVLVVEAPDDLLVRVDEAGRAVTLLRLNAEREGQTGEVKLVVLDSQGGRTEVTITVERPALLPEIVPPKPLLLSIGETRILPARLAEDTDVDVTWSVASSSVPGIDVAIESLAGGHAELSLTASDTAEEAEHRLTLTAADDFYTRTATLFLVVAAAAAKPRLKLSLFAPDGSGESVTIATLTPTLTAVSLQADLEGTLPDLEMLKGSDGFVSFQITFERRRQGVLFTVPTTVATVEVEEGDSGLSIMEPIGEQLASLALVEGDEVSLSIEHWKDGAPTDEFIVGDALVLPVLGRVIFDRDNDGLADSIEPDPDNPDPGVLGPVTAEFAGGGADEVSLSLGNLARSLALAGCGGVTLTLRVDESGSTVTGCGAETLSLDVTLAESAFAAFGPGTYQFFDLLATFDSGQADPDAFLLITLPLPPAEPQTAYRIYRFDGTEWVPVIDAGLPSGSGSGAIGPGIQGATGNGEDGASFYAFDFDRDGSVPLLLLVESVPVVPAEAPSLQVDSMYQDRCINIAVGMPRIIRLVGLAASFTAVATGSLNVYAEVQTATIDGIVVDVVKLTGLKRTKNGAEAVVIVAFDEDGNAVASTTLYVAVGNQAPAIKFFRALLNGERGEQITTRFELAPGSQTEVIVVIEDPDEDENFVLGLTGDGGGIAEFVPRLGFVADVPQVTNILILTAGDRPRSPFKVTLTATDQSDLSEALGEIEVCVLNESGLCPAASRGGGGSGLLWLFLAAPAVLARLRRRRAARVQ